MTHKVHAGEQGFSRGCSPVYIVVVADDCRALDVTDHVNSEKVRVYNFLTCKILGSAGCILSEISTIGPTRVQIHGRKWINISNPFKLSSEIRP